jgi:ankyrin repeat protein
MISFAIEDVNSDSHTVSLLPPSTAESPEHGMSVPDSVPILPTAALDDFNVLFNLMNHSSGSSVCPSAPLYSRIVLPLSITCFSLPFLQKFLVNKHAFSEFLRKQADSTSNPLLPEQALHQQLLQSSAHAGSSLSDDSGPDSPPSTLVSFQSSQSLALLSSLDQAPSASLEQLSSAENARRNVVYSQTASKNTLETYDEVTEVEVAFIRAAGRGNIAGMQTALRAGYSETITSLLQHVPSRDSRLHQAYAYDSDWTDEEFLDWILSDSPILRSSRLHALHASPFLMIRIDAQLEKGGAAIHYAALAGKNQAIDLLLSHGAQIDLAAGNGSTALHWAAGNGHLETVKLLIARGADPLHTTSTWCVDVFGRNSGQTPLHWAAASGYTDCVLYLHEYAPGAIAVNDEKDNTPLSLAAKDVRLDTMAAIKKALNEEYVAISLKTTSFSASRTIG